MDGGERRSRKSEPGEGGKRGRERGGAGVLTIHHPKETLPKKGRHFFQSLGFVLQALRASCSSEKTLQVDSSCIGSTGTFPSLFTRA